MKKQTASEIFGKLLPYPIINSVTLESGGSPNVSKNPHILNPDSPDTQSGVSGLKSTVSFSIRDVPGPKGANAFFDKDDLLSMMSFIIVQCTDASKTANYIKNPINLFNAVSEFGYPFSDLNADIEGIAYFQTTAEALSGEDNTFALKNINGDNIIERSSTITFNSPNNKPQHLSFFCIATLNKSALKSNYNLTEAEAQSIVFFESSHIIAIDGGSASYTEVQYLLPDGNIWTGPTHQHNGVWMAGAEHTNEPHPILQRINVSSNKVRDFRDFTELSYLNDSLYQSQSVLNQFEQLEVGKTITNKKPLLNSWITHSPPTSNAANSSLQSHIFIALDRASLTEKYGFLGTYPIEIKSLKLVRTGAGETFSTKVDIKSNMHKLHNADNYDFYYKSQPVKKGTSYSYKLELELDQASQTAFIESSINLLSLLVQNLDSYYKTASGVSISNVSSQDSKLGVKERKKIPYYDVYSGKYIAEFKNNADAIEKLSTINDLRSQTQQFFFLVASNLLKLNSAISNALDLETGSPDGILAVARVYQTILDKVQKIYGNKTLKQGYSQEHTQKTATKSKGPDLIVLELKPELDLSNQPDYGYHYLNIGSPGNSNANSLLYSDKQSFEDFIQSKKEKYFNDSDSAETSLFTKYGTLGVLADSLYSFFEPQKIYTGIEGDEVKTLNTADLTLGLGMLDVSPVLARIFNYLDEKQVGTNNPNIFNILSSKGISIDFKPAITSVTLEDTTDDDRATNDITGLENEDTFDDQYQKNIDTLNKINLSETYNTILSELKKSDDIKMSRYKNISYYDISLNSTFDATTALQSLNIISGGTIKTENLKLENNYNGENILSSIIATINKSLEDFATDATQSEQASFRDGVLASKLREMPIQLKSLLMFSAPFDEGATATFVQSGQLSDTLIRAKENTQPSTDDLTLWANFKNLMRVEFLSGFENGIMNPKWETLKELPETTNGNKLLCRLVKYENMDYNIVRPKSYELPIYSEYFLINLE